MSLFYIKSTLLFAIYCKKSDLRYVIKTQRNMTLETEVPFDFEFSYTKGEPADRDYPGSNDEVVITHVTLFGVAIPLHALSAEVIDAMIDEVHEKYRD